ncbi:DUF6503 family protein [Flagellimonas meishanensis]|uniref:DUF6503 family protein n=1 Tax=Flagellimonas meishanensis TaxID=2873264 RepID=UPI001CA6B043|nr:DUF6503 family protein [[Muricauda] meishanensis]
MKKLSFVLIAFALMACKTEPRKASTEPKVQADEVSQSQKYPTDLSKVFALHGELERWNEMRTLSFEIPNPEGVETHTIDLWSRQDHVATDKFSMGYDGQDVWLSDPQDVYKGDAAFYHNLMFYFYAMPFVLADDGIVYSETEPLVFENVSYPGIKIGYETGVGISSKDEYFVHYNPETYRMEWLGYTVTYMSGEPSDNVRWIRYDDWQSVEGLMLPKTITWHNYEGSTILDARDTLPFNNVTLSSMAKPKEFYKKPENAAPVEVKKS